ncbi:lysine--tRNA ligase [Candidatus Uhrbacteria bacterium]|nr:lysine--tRNA ligase [Candidatus Uhrbacteria bacterium]
MPVPIEADVRRGKLRALGQDGIDPYPSSTRRDATCADALARFDAWSAAGKRVTLAGRLMTTRVHGGLIFADLADATGKIQILVKQDVVGDAPFALFLDRIDPGDIVEAAGTLFTTKRGEKTLQVSEWAILAKALLPLPEKWHGLTDQELRYRHRELDLIANPEVRETFRKRSQVVRSLRRALEDEGFEEVETPILQAIPGGATARPFVTHHNALDMDLYLRIAPELYLKRLIVGGYEKVFEIGRQFRNEGMDWSHNPEFTSCEFYWAYQDAEGLMAFTETLLMRVITEVNGSPLVKDGDETIDFTPPWPRVTFRDAIKDASGIDIAGITRRDLLAKMKKLGIEVEDEGAGIGKLFDGLYKELVQAKRIQPSFVTEYPIEMEPLAKKCGHDARFVQRFQLLAAGRELLKAYAELNDPIDQMERFEAQERLREEGDAEAQHIDMAFVKALEHGMPPTAGWGMGIDRFVALIAGERSVKDVILFPTMRPTDTPSGRKAASKAPAAPKRRNPTKKS